MKRFKSVTPQIGLKIIDSLKSIYPDADTALHFKTPYQLAVATILSAQCTDVRVNQVTPALFAKFPDASATARAKLPELEKLVHSTGFYRAKAKSILEMSKSLLENHGGEMPKTIDELTKLRGIGRKTANVVLSNGFGIHEGIAVDTHVKRLSFRMGFTRQTDPVKVECDLMDFFPKKYWDDITNTLIDHGRAICKAQRPQCEVCTVNKYCPKNGVR